jgi:uncharacterized SAM-binding protein YcdF (DUF218 family)
MTFFRLTKILTQLVYPLSLSLLLLLVALLLLRRGRIRAARRFLAAGIALLWLFSVPLASYPLAWSLERRFPRVAPEDSPRAGAIVLLGGGIAPARTPLHWMNLNESADRIVHAARLWRAGKAPIIVVSGGGGPHPDAAQKPADAMADLLVEWGIPREVLVLERRSRNTWENALYSKQLLDERGIRDALVVTSAGHMWRSLALFRSLGVDAIPAATDYTISGPFPWSRIETWLPSAGSLEGTAASIKEYLGVLVYWLRGRIRSDVLFGAS